jgi:hypothetical protein
MAEIGCDASRLVGLVVGVGGDREAGRGRVAARASVSVPDSDGGESSALSRDHQAGSPWTRTFVFKGLTLTCLASCRSTPAAACACNRHLRRRDGQPGRTVRGRGPSHILRRFFFFPGKLQSVRFQWVEHRPMDRPEL